MTSLSSFKLMVVVLPLLVLTTAVSVWAWSAGQPIVALFAASVVTVLVSGMLWHSHQTNHDNESQERLAQLTHLLAATSDFVGISDLHGRVLYLNKAACELIGVDPETDLTQYNTRDFYSPEMQQRLREHILPTVRAKGIWQGESTFQTFRGETIYTTQVITCYSQPDGTIAYYGTIARDQSERITTAQQLASYAERLHALSHMGSELNASLDFQTILHTTAVQLHHLVAYDGLSLLMTTNDPDKLQLMVHKMPESDEVNQLMVKVPATDLEKIVLRTKAPLLIDNTAVDKRWDTSLTPPHKIKSWLSIPMTLRGNVVGLLNMSKQKPSFFGEQDVHLVLTFANQCATALVNAQLYQQTEQELQTRIQTEQALRESENRFRSLYETMTQGVYYRDRHGRVTSANPAAEKILGQKLTDMNTAYENGMPRPVLRADGTPFTPDTYPTNIALRTGQIVPDTLMRIYNPTEQTYRWIILDAVPEFLPGEEKPYQVYAIFRDVTEQREAKEALEMSEERFRTLFETMSQGVIYRDKQGHVVDANPALRRIFKLDPTEIQQEYDHDGLKWQIFDEWDNPMRPSDMPSSIALHTGEPVLQKLFRYLQPQTGEQRWLLIDAIPQFRPGESEPYQAYMVVNDITMQKQAEEALRQAQKMESLGILAGGIAHDFNNLLVALLGQSSLAMRKLDEAHPARRHVQKVVQAAEHAANLTRQMLAYSGKGRFEVRHLQLNELIQENLDLLRVAISKNVQLETDLAPILPLIEVDVSQIQQIVMNLVINASEALDPQMGGVVRIQTAPLKIEDTAVSDWLLPNSILEPGEFVLLSVTDNGHGMTAEQLARIFDPFFTTKDNGRGLGLAAVLGIVRGHKGGLKVHSTSGEGTQFQLAFPVSQTAPTPTSLPDTGPLSLPAQGEILIIDDEASVREAIVDILQAEGLTVVTQPNGEAGIHYYEQNQAHILLVILDLSMPGLNGHETFAALTKINPAVQVLLSSGYSEMEAVRYFDGRPHQPAGFIPKPFNAQQLLKAVKKRL